jgi:hypothetical protein
VVAVDLGVAVEDLDLVEAVAAEVENQDPVAVEEVEDRDPVAVEDLEVVVEEVEDRGPVEVDLAAHLLVLEVAVVVEVAVAVEEEVVLVVLPLLPQQGERSQR